MPRELIDTIADGTGSEIEVTSDDDGAVSLRIETTPYTRWAVVTLVADAEVEQFDRAWQAARARRQAPGG